MADTLAPGGWQLDVDGARAYQRHLVAVFMDDWAADLVDTVGISHGEHVIDVACGTGAVSRQAAPSGAFVTGVDVNPAMLEVAGEVAAQQGVDVALQRAPAEDLPMERGTADVVVCQQGLQFMDAPTALGEMHRVLRAGGRLGVSVCRGLRHQPGYRVLIDVAERHAGASAAAVLRSPYALGGDGELTHLVRSAGFTGVRTTIRVWSARFDSPSALLAAETTSSPLGDIVSALPAATRDALRTDLTRALAPHTDDAGVVFPFETVVVVAKRPAD